MKHELLLLGKTKDAFIKAGIQEYASRLKHYTGIELTFLKEKGKTKGRVNIEKQGDLLLQGVAIGALKVVLDAKGRQCTSEEFSKKIDEWEMRGIKKVCYLIGGPEGHSPLVLQKADFLLSFSKMTFTHDMIRMLLVEQLYRAYTIKAGEKYHK